MMKRSSAILGLLLLTLALPACADSKGGEAAAKGGNSAVAAKVGDVTITVAEVEKAAEGQLRQLEMQRYEIMRRQLDQMITDQLITKEAAARGVKPEDLMKAEVVDKSVAPTDQEISQYYEANKERAQGKPLEYWKEMITKELAGQKQRARQEAFFAELRAKTPTKVSLDAPRVNVPLPAGEPAKGPESAPVTMVLFSDFQCPYCKRAHPTLERILTEYKDKIHFVYRDYPLSFHPRATPASEASRCAVDQGKYWEYWENLMEMQGDLSDEDLVKRAKDVGMDGDKFKACYDAKKYTTVVQAAFQDGQKVGVTGTPTFFINGIMMVGAKPYEEIKDVIDSELARKGS